LARYDSVSAMSLALFNLRAIASDIEHEFFEISLRLNSVEELVKTDVLRYISGNYLMLSSSTVSLIPSI
jgi:hypothetical protein